MQSREYNKRGSRKTESERRREPHKVLVVDDEKPMLAMARAILEASGYNVYESQTGENALQIYEGHMSLGSPIQVVLMDLTLPGGISGVEAMQQIKTINPNAKVIAASGYFENNAAEQCRQMGFTGVLPKPYTAENLRHLIQWSISSK